MISLLFSIERIAKCSHTFFNRIYGLNSFVCCANIIFNNSKSCNRLLNLVSLFFVCFSSSPSLSVLSYSFCHVSCQWKINVMKLNSQESLESLIRAQIRVLESQLFTKSSELQEDISMKKYDLQTKRLHLAALRAQVNIYVLYA